MPQIHRFQIPVAFSIALMTLSLTAPAPAEDAAKTNEFRDLVAAEWEYTLREAPTFASHLGDKRHNDRWPDVSLRAIERRFAHHQEVLKQLDDIDPALLPPDERLNYVLFRKDFANEVEQYPFGWHLVPLNQREGIQDESQVADGIVFTSVKDYDDWIARLGAFPAYMDQTIELMREGIRRKIVQPKVVMKRLPEQIKKQLVEDPAESLYYKPLKNISADVPAGEQERLRKEASSAIREHVVPAYRKFAKFFDEEYFPACYDEVGASQLPRGQEFYALKARQFTTTGLTPVEIHEIGLAEVTRIRQEMEAIVKQVKFEGSFQEFLVHLRTDKQFYYDDPRDLMNGYLALCKRVDPHLTKLFKTLPRIPYGLEPIPEHIAPDTTAAYYRQPSADGQRAGTYFVNLYRPEMRPKYEMEALSLHEAVPGIICSLPCKPNWASCRRFAATAGSPRISKAGRCMPKVWEINSAAMRIRTPNSVSSRMRCGEPCGWLSIRACTANSGPANKRSTSSGRTRRKASWTL